MDFTVLNWNIGGAKVLEMKTRERREQVKCDLNESLRHLIRNHRPRPDVVTLQEIVQYKEPGDGEVRDLVEPIEGYTYFPFKLIDSHLFSSKAKWRRVMKESDWAANAYFAQGNGLLCREDAPFFPIWDLSDLAQAPQKTEARLIEKVSVESGLYFGDRNTEPRAALVAHLIYDPEIEPERKKAKRKPQDIFIVNVHLTTLMMEREGIPEIDARASAIRRNQLEVIFTGIVSRYNMWHQEKYPERSQARLPERGETFQRHPPIWILAGDFNFTMESEEYALVQRYNFVDAIPQKGTGTKAKGAGKPATLTLDYVFAGPKFIAVDPLIDHLGIENNSVNHDVTASDHYPMFATIPIHVRVDRSERGLRRAAEGRGIAAEASSLHSAPATPAPPAPRSGRRGAR